MSDTVIRVEHLSKQYRLGQIGGMTLRDDVDRLVARLRGKPDPLLKIGQTDHGNRNGEILWALNDVSFEVKQGEALGIIGRNGAGKSTLLKILSRVTAPTLGIVKVKGRVASLLEVGTGFHPELTGRENIYLNGAILGMKQAETNRKFDEIVDFSGVEQFIDTPVKRYSSGMYVRLAFAIAAHLEPEVLMVDEVLAVGDIGFQKKCLGKIGEVTREGRTVLLVSHNMSSVGSLCGTSLWLNGGRIAHWGATRDAIAVYESSVSGRVLPRDGRVSRESSPDSNQSPRIAWFEVRDRQDVTRTSFDFGDFLKLVVRLSGEIPPSSYLEWGIRSFRGNNVSSGGTFMATNLNIKNARDQIVCDIGPLPLSQGVYTLSLTLGVLPGQILDRWEDAYQFRVISCDPSGTGLQFDSRRGDVYIGATYHIGV
jgi:ABC-type polysaccharide/polyol phosphate transport system ATPase subunit